MSGDQVRIAKLVFVGLLVLMSVHAFRDEYGYIAIIGDILTAIHEFGHYLFWPLGETMHILGGSLFEVTFPLVFVAYFLQKNPDGTRRDPYGAMLSLWVSAIGLLGVAIYCADSRAGQLMLLNGLTGSESDVHDWRQLLEGWHMLNKDVIIGARMRAVALLMCVGSLGAAAWFALTPPAPKPADDETAARFA